MHVGGAIKRTLELPAGAVKPGVEADSAGETELVVRCREERLAATEAEADAHGTLLPGALAQFRERGLGVGLDLDRARLRDVLDVFEILAARAEASGPAEVVDRDRVMPRLGESFCQLDVERIQAAN